MKGLMCDWLHLVDNLTHDQPQAAYAAFTRSVQNKESYLERLVPDCASLFQELEYKIAQEFLLAIFGLRCPLMRVLFSQSWRFECTQSC